MKSWEIKPARDLGLPLGQRLRSLARERGLVGLALNAAWRHTLRLYLAAAHRLEVEGRENLPPPPFVIIANHASHLDALTLAAALRGEAARAAHALAAGEVFFGKPAGAAFAAYAINALPVWRGRTQRSELKLLRERLLEDRLAYILFPEGTRSRDGTMAPFQPGLAMLVAGTPVPVVPCWIEGAHECWPPSQRWPRPGRLRLRIGKPLVFEDVAPDAEGRARIAQAARDAVVALRPPG
ncbi:1-acyl-sn-glycerol-3-phosphate acyltransferase [Roseomonas stagni]|uniref:1-acyl-sn-glycerol-3-phosphate acyltransferase n=1 Tax=Falsiroseomonas algicola TaxID=2716930 RepID=A0A6M1LQ73_9PROT|nr:lysophospholipid acyltransferase family protein [Falsiroseomonas algicola]NGM22253.1 1-acyl-sn-glycerol-3-phosphate acyltransferase [Falsiroseomonas algicola]